MNAIDVRVALSSIVRDELARRRLPDFIELVEPSYERARHTVVLCDHLEAVERGDVDRLIVMLPPRHGKTMHVSQALPAWTLGRNPRVQIILASCGAELAEGNSRKARSYMRSDRWPFECRVSEESRAQPVAIECRRHPSANDSGGTQLRRACQ